MEAHEHIDFDYEGFAKRLSEAIFPEKPSTFASRVGVAHPTLLKYLKAGGTSPRLDIASALARAAGVTIDWLVWGEGDAPAQEDFVKVPRYDVTLAAGHGRWLDGRHRLDDIPFTSAFLRKHLNRTGTAGLSVLESHGDSMFPTIADGALVLVDELDQRITDGIFAFVHDGDARLKRFRRSFTGITIISDNDAYPPETLDTAQFDQLQIIGRVRWVSQTLI